MVSINDVVSYILVAIMIILMITPLAIPLKMTLFPASQKNNVPIVGSSDQLASGGNVSTSTQTSPLLESFHEVEDASSDTEILIAEGEGAIRKKRKPKRGDDFKFKEVLVKADFWLLWFAYSLGVGSGVTVLNNLAQIGVASGVEDATILLSVFSFCNFIGRLGAGAVSEHFVRYFYFKSHRLYSLWLFMTSYYRYLCRYVSCLMSVFVLHSFSRSTFFIMNLTMKLL
jgi:hypothetical protein